MPTAPLGEVASQVNRAVVNATELPPVPSDGSCQVNTALDADTDRCDEVSTPLSGPQPEWTMSKTSDPESGTIVAAGGTIAYALRVENLGDVPLDGLIVRDDLAGVLEHAALAGAWPEGASLDGSVLTWRVPRIEVGTSARLEYTVRVRDDAWAETLVNRAWGEGAVSPQDCVEEDPCEVRHETPGRPADPPLATTGAGTVGEARTAASVSAALLLLAAGSASIAAVIRSRRAEGEAGAE